MADGERVRRDDAADDGVGAAVGSFVGLVEGLRVRTTGRVLTVARGVVYALVIATMGVAVVALVAVAGVRLADELLPQEVWLAYLVVGALFGCVGAVLWRLRRPKQGASDAAEVVE